MIATATQIPKAQTGKPVELGRYETESRERRVLVGRRINGKVRVYDAPLPVRSGRIFLVEPRVENLRELVALVHDYKDQAERFGDVPMRWTFADRAIAAMREDELG